MKRTAQDIRRDLADARRRHDELQEHGNSVVSDYDLNLGYDAAFSMKLIGNHIAYYEQEFMEATKHGEQLSFEL